MNSYIELYFSIRSDETTPEFITDYLGLTPNFSLVKGAARREGQTSAKENVWTIKAINSKQLNMEKQVQALLEILMPIKQKLITISHQCSFDVECVIHLNGNPTSPDIGFKVNAVRFFAEVGIELGVDIYS